MNTRRRAARRLGRALAGALGLAALGAVLSSGCKSEPCVGPACDVACSDELCGSSGETVASGATGGSGGTSGGGGKAGNGGAAGASGRGGSNATAGANGTAGPCESSATCNAEHGFACVQGQCRHACRSHYDCAGEGTCEALAGEAAHYCNLETSPADGDYTYCPNGDECPLGYLCLGTGPGDARAYCSAPCQDNSACAPGFYCDVITNADGEELPYCVRRGFCAPCESDTDCLAVPGQICAKDQSGEKICTKLCDEAVDSCSWGNATICGVWDSELGLPTCAHRFGSCRAEGKSCEPCTRDSDCPLGFCHGSSYTGERWCVDQSVSCDCDGLDTEQNICENGNGCPVSPGGAEMMCFDDERFTGDPFGHHCFGASTMGGAGLGSPQSGCWKPL